ncbi:hypothetical protein GQ42DRAFT_159845 [Ramicandelaber brevisporus]|nr:hypothetical protein GQ42DRAFT_159845 [Ramicandelaber brevisporus]
MSDDQTAIPLPGEIVKRVQASGAFDMLRKRLAADFEASEYSHRVKKRARNEMEYTLQQRPQLIDAVDNVAILKDAAARKVDEMLNRTELQQVFIENKAFTDLLDEVIDRAVKHLMDPDEDVDETSFLINHLSARHQPHQQQPQSQQQKQQQQQQQQQQSETTKTAETVEVKEASAKSQSSPKIATSLERTESSIQVSQMARATANLRVEDDDEEEEGAISDTPSPEPSNP